MIFLARDFSGGFSGSSVLFSVNKLSFGSAPARFSSIAQATVFCCCVDFAVNVCRILLRSLLPAPRALACSQVSSLRFLLPRFFLLVILSASVCFSSWQQASALLFTMVPRWEIVLRSGSAFRSLELPLRRCSALSSSVLLVSPFSCHITSAEIHPAHIFELSDQKA
jgi:small-conductance mechanosensitive channel